MQLFCDPPIFLGGHYKNHIHHAHTPNYIYQMSSQSSKHHNLAKPNEPKTDPLQKSKMHQAEHTRPSSPRDESTAKKPRTEKHVDAHSAPDATCERESESTADMEHKGMHKGMTLMLEHYRDVGDFKDATPPEYHLCGHDNYRPWQLKQEDFKLQFEEDFLRYALMFWVVHASQVWYAEQEQKKQDAKPRPFDFWNDVVAHSLYDMIYADADTPGYPEVDLHLFDDGIYEGVLSQVYYYESDDDDDDEKRAQHEAAPDAGACSNKRKVLALALRNFVIESAKDDDHLQADRACYFWHDIAGTIMRIIVDLSKKREGMVFRGKRTVPPFGEEEMEAGRWGDGYDHAAKGGCCE